MGSVAPGEMEMGRRRSEQSRALQLETVPDTGTVAGLSVPGDAATTAGRHRTNRRAARPGRGASGRRLPAQIRS